MSSEALPSVYHLPLSIGDHQIFKPLFSRFIYKERIRSIRAHQNHRSLKRDGELVARGGSAKGNSFTVISDDKYLVIPLAEAFSQLPFVVSLAQSKSYVSIFSQTVVKGFPQLLILL